MVVDVDLGAINRNYGRLTRLWAKPLILMVKADAYGHGASRVARAVNAPYYGVATEAEGIPIRELGKEVLVIAPSFYSVALARRYDMIPVIGEARLLGEAIRVGLRRCHIAVNSGMNRLGFTGEKECYRMAAALASGGVRVEGIATHYKAGDEGTVRAQNAAFDPCVLAIRRALAERGQNTVPFTHVTGSGALLSHPYEMLRVGLAAYGYHDEYATAGVPLEKAMKVTSLILKKKRIHAGDTLGYAGGFRASHPCLAYTVLGGYGDGVAREEVGRRVIASGRRLRIAAISMDSFEMISEGIDLEVGSRVIILSDAVDATYVAKHRGTIPYEVLLGYDVPRAERYYEDERGDPTHR